MITYYNLLDFLYNLSKKLPNWLMMFNQGTVYILKNPQIRTRDNSNYIFSKTTVQDIDEVAQVSGHSLDDLKKRLEAGDSGIISRNINSKKITTCQWSHTGSVYIRGFNLTLHLNNNSAYFYWAYSVPEVRITGIINTSFQKMIDILKENNIYEYFALVEFWNLSAHKFHQRLQFEKIKSVIYIKLFFVRLTLIKELHSNKISCEVHIFPIIQIDMI